MVEAKKLVSRLFVHSVDVGVGNVHREPAFRDELKVHMRHHV